MLRQDKSKYEKTFSDLSQARIKLMDLELVETYKIQVKEAATEKKRHQDNAPKLYWLIRRNMSEESTNKIRLHLKDSLERSERIQDPVALWQAIKITHTAFSLVRLLLRSCFLHLDLVSLRQLEVQ